MAISVGVVKSRTRIKGALFGITDVAFLKLKTEIDKNQMRDGILISKRGRGCGQAFQMDFIHKNDLSRIKKFEFIEKERMRIYVDNKSLLSIAGAEIDFSEDRLSSRFIIKVPNAESICGCGSTFIE
ncbi:MAG: Iron-sulfur assembly protein 1 [Marteilia pararefringens]